MNNKPTVFAANQKLTALSELEAFYHFPKNSRGAGQRLAIVEYGGGFYMSDIVTYCKQSGISVPKINVHNSAANKPLDLTRLGHLVDAINRGADVNTLRQKHAADYDQMLATIEVTADIIVCAALANDAEIDVYFAERDKSAARHNQTVTAFSGVFKQILNQPPAAVSLSWSQPEYDVYSAGVKDLKVLDSALSMLSQKGVAISCASGDLGAAGVPVNEVSRNKRNVHYPASSTHVIAVGGSAPVIDSSGKWVGETVFNDIYHGYPFASGGGYSGCITPDPVRKKAAPIPPAIDDLWVGGMGSSYGRGVPDVAAFADQTRGVKIVVAGRDFGMGGTSVAAPLWASLITRIFAITGSVADFGQLLYKPAFRSAFNDVANGDNDTSGGKYKCYVATKGWDPCTGLGTPNGEKLLASLQAELTARGVKTTSGETVV